jgi:hypothetical protein
MVRTWKINNQPECQADPAMRAWAVGGSGCGAFMTAVFANHSPSGEGSHWKAQQHGADAWKTRQRANPVVRIALQTICWSLSPHCTTSRLFPSLYFVWRYRND